MDADAGGLQRLTDNSAADTQATWSPDGRKLAFTSECDGNPEIYIMNADGSLPIRITANPASDADPIWRPEP